MTDSERDDRIGRGEIQSRAASGIAWTMIHAVATIPLAFVANLIIARTLQSEGYGELAFLTTVMTIASAVVQFGVSDAVMQYGAAAHARRDARSVRFLLSASQGFRFLVTIPVLVAAVVVIGRDAPGWLLVVAITFGVVIPNAVGGSGIALSIENKTGPMARIALLGNVATQVFAVLAVLVAQSADAVWATRLAAACIPFVLYLLPLSASYRWSVVRPVFPRGFPRGFWRFALPAWGSALIGLLVTMRTEVVLLTWFSSAADVGIYALAVGVSAYVFAPAGALTGPLLPALAALRAVDEVAMGRAFDRTIRVSSVISGGLAAFGLPVLGALLPILYGTSFASAVLPMLVLGVVGSVSAMAAPVVAFTLARLSSSLLLAINITALVVNVGAAFALIPIAGVWGAVIANSLGVIVRLVLIVEGERRALRMSLMHLGRLILPVVVATLAVASGWVLGIPFSAEPLIQAGVAGVAALLVFLTLIWVLRAGLEQPDANAVASIAPARMRRVMVLALKTITRR